MAKQTSKNASVVAIMGNFASLFFFPTRNYRTQVSSDGNLKQLRTSMSGMGWWRNEPIPAEKISDCYAREGNPGEMAKCGPHAGGLMPDFIQECLNLRQAEWDALKTDGTTEGKQKLVVFEKMFVSYDKLIRPEYLPVACFQRGSQYFGSQVERYKGDATGQGSDPFLEVPIEVTTFATEGDRLEKQVLENEGRGIGLQATSYRDKLRTAVKFFQMGKNQNYFRQLYSSTTGQKLHGLLRLDGLWPNLKIVNRVLMEKPAEEAAAEMSSWIPYEKVSVTDLTSLIRRSPQSGDRLNAGESPVAGDDIDKWLRDIKRNDGNEKKVMGKDTFKTQSQQNPVDMVKDIMKGALENNQDYITKYVPLAAGLNVLTTLASKGHYPALELVLVRLGQNMESNPTQNVLFCLRDVVEDTVEELYPVKKPSALAAKPQEQNGTPEEVTPQDTGVKTV